MAEAVDRCGAPLNAGDDLLLQGHTELVVRNRLNQVAFVELDAGLACGNVVRVHQQATADHVP